MMVLPMIGSEDARPKTVAKATIISRSNGASPNRAVTCAASRRRLAASNLAKVGVIAGGHPSDIAPEIVVAFSFRAQWRIEARTQRTGNEGENCRIDAGRLAAYEERFAAEKFRSRGDRSRAERDDLGGPMPTHALAIKRAPELSADEGDQEWTHRRRDFPEELLRTFGEIRIIKPAGIDESPIKIVLRHLFKRPSDSALLRRQSLFEIDAVFVFQMPADE